MRPHEWLDFAPADRGACFLSDDPATPNEFVTYAELAASGRQAAGLLGHYDIRPGDMVCILIPDLRDFLVALFGVLAAGATAVPLTPTPSLPSPGDIRRLAECIRPTRPAVILTAPGLRDHGVTADELAGICTIVADFTAAIASEPFEEDPFPQTCRRGA